MSEHEGTPSTLAFLIHDDEVLLGIKQKKVGAGLYNGYGGKVEEQDGGDIEKTMVRETEEEIAVTPTEYQKIAEVQFHNPLDDARLGKMYVHVYLVTEWQGEPTDSDEMRGLEWFKRNEVPYGSMLKSDAWWLEKVLGGGTWKASVKYDKDWNFIESESTIEQVEKL
ncbi:MAG: NUDIX domain-containing protein [Candidatus Nomurabacteria bacterium]|jgi:8-oxo-dGTP diphosphatase|nr:NUDIX domain-containing protein [Candidatus Nomurabacteria bacterium]